MADFCRQCTEQDGLPGGDYEAGTGDLQGLVTEIQFRDGYCANAICEGCAGGEFDHLGNCLGGCLNPSHDPKP